MANLYRIEGIPDDNDRFLNLAKVKEELGRQLGALVVLYSPGEQDYAMAFQPSLNADLSKVSFKVKIEKNDAFLSAYPPY